MDDAQGRQVKDPICRHFRSSACIPGSVVTGSQQSGCSVVPLDQSILNIPPKGTQQLKYEARLLVYVFVWLFVLMCFCVAFIIIKRGLYDRFSHIAFTHEYLAENTGPDNPPTRHNLQRRVQPVIKYTSWIALC